MSWKMMVKVTIGSHDADKDIDDNDTSRDDGDSFESTNGDEILGGWRALIAIGYERENRMMKLRQKKMVTKNTDVLMTITMEMLKGHIVFILH